MKKIIVFFVITLFIGACDMNRPKLNGTKAELISSPEKLEAYTKQGKFTVKGKTIDGANFDSRHLQNMTFEDTTLKQYWHDDGTLLNAKFINIDFKVVSFSGTTLTNVTFENATFHDDSFIGASFVNVIFKNCKFNGTKFTSATGKITFINSELDSVKFLEAQVAFVFESSYVHNKSNPRVAIFNAQKGSSFVLVDTVLAGANLDGDVVSIKVSDGAILDSGFGGTIGSLEIDGADLNFSMKAKVKSVLVTNSNIELFGLGENIDHAAIRDCKSADVIAIMFSNIKELNIENCDISTFEPLESKFSHFNLRNSKISDIDMQKTTIKDFTLNNVKFSTINIEQAQAAQQNFNNVSVASGGSLKDTGSNIKFQ